MELNIAHIQHFSTGDGPGIRTTVFFKGCNLHCPWCHNPETIRPEPQVLHYAAAGRDAPCGERLPVDTVLRRVLADKAFYDASGGGVTASGGEPLLQPQGVAALFSALKTAGVHTLLDTAGCVPWASFSAVLPFTDTVFFDWKTSDPAVCAEMIGGDLTLIRQNLGRCAAGGADIHVRIPLIPGVNDTPDDARRAAAALAPLGIRQIDVLPFHRMGSAKWAALGLDYAYRGVPPLSPKAARPFADSLRERFTVTIEGDDE